MGHSAARAGRARARGAHVSSTRVRRPCTLISNTTFRPLTTRGFEAADVSGIFIAPSAPATCARSFFLHFSASPSVPPCQRLAGLASAAPESQVSSARARLPRPQLAQKVCLQLLLARACFASDAQPAAPSALSQTDARASPPAHAGVEATSSARRARGCAVNVTCSTGWCLPPFLARARCARE